MNNVFHYLRIFQFQAGRLKNLNIPLTKGAGNGYPLRRATSALTTSSQTQDHFVVMPSRYQEEFEELHLIGHGGFGRVYQVQKKWKGKISCGKLIVPCEWLQKINWWIVICSRGTVWTDRSMPWRRFNYPGKALGKISSKFSVKWKCWLVCTISTLSAITRPGWNSIMTAVRS